MTLWEAIEHLGVTIDTPRRAARRAYLKQLKHFKPETDPDGFMQLRTAWELVDAWMADRDARAPGDPPAAVAADPAPEPGDDALSDAGREPSGVGSDVSKPPEVSAPEPAPSASSTTTPAGVPPWVPPERTERWAAIERARAEFVRTWSVELGSLAAQLAPDQAPADAAAAAQALADAGEARCAAALIGLLLDELRLLPELPSLPVEAVATVLAALLDRTDHDGALATYTRCRLELAGRPMPDAGRWALVDAIFAIPPTVAPGLLAVVLRAVARGNPASARPDVATWAARYPYRALHARLELETHSPFLFDLLGDVLPKTLATPGNTRPAGSGEDAAPPSREPYRPSQTSTGRPAPGAPADRAAKGRRIGALTLMVIAVLAAAFFLGGSPRTPPPPRYEPPPLAPDPRLFTLPNAGDITIVAPPLPPSHQRNHQRELIAEVSLERACARGLAPNLCTAGRLALDASRRGDCEATLLAMQALAHADPDPTGTLEQLKPALHRRLAEVCPKR